MQEVSSKKESVKFILIYLLNKFLISPVVIPKVRHLERGERVDEKNDKKCHRGGGAAKKSDVTHSKCFRAHLFCNSIFHVLYLMGL